MAGHPDDQTYSQWRGPTLGQGSNYLLSAATPLTLSGVVTNFASLLVFIGSSPPKGATVTITFYIDAGFTTPIGSNTWTLANGQAIQMIVPCLGNFVKVFITTTDTTGLAITYSVSPMNVLTPSPRYNLTPNYRALFNQSIAAGADTIFQLNSVGGGPAFAYFKDLAGSAKLEMGVITLNPDGSRLARLVFTGLPVTLFLQQFTAPDVPLGIEVTNTDGAAAHSFDAALMVDGR